ncbi:MAG: hypothetical protein JXP34_05665 [Planctomycetes bacterium]|nr:hypothetical protein [Planctomycetota bacterium]
MEKIGPEGVGKDRALQVARACAEALEQRFGAREVHIVGSLAGQGPWHSRSDIDLAVGGLAPEKYVQAFSALADMLPEGMDLDLIPLEGVPPEVASRLRGESKMPDDPKLALKVEISDEIAHLDRLAGHARSILSNLPAEPGFIETNAAGKILHDFYCGVERAFERIAVRLGPGLPAGENWHVVLLRGMASEIPGVRGPVIDPALSSRLAEYLRFRHLFRHSYGFDLEWPRLAPLLADLEPTFRVLRGALEGFIDLILYRP